MRTLPIPDEVFLACKDDVLAKMLGGRNVVEALLFFHQDRLVPEEIAVILKLRSRQNVVNLLDRAADDLCELGWWPPHWNRRYRSPGHKRTVNLEKLHA